MDESGAKVTVGADCALGKRLDVILRGLQQMTPIIEVVLQIPVHVRDTDRPYLAEDRAMSDTIRASTGAMRLVAEAFPWSEGSTFAYTLDNHNSVVGMRGYALEQQASAVAVHIMTPNPSGTFLQST